MVSAPVTANAADRDDSASTFVFHHETRDRTEQFGDLPRLAFRREDPEHAGIVKSEQQTFAVRPTHICQPSKWSRNASIETSDQMKMPQDWPQPSFHIQSNTRSSAPSETR